METLSELFASRERLLGQSLDDAAASAASLEGDAQTEILQENLNVMLVLR